ncbi:MULTISPECIES: Ku protein [unclassified Streptomyces]|uniref:Ku protein n=1 Tax=unclassified Streptomyces TaxID=2593676 RepID=UPI003863BAD8
MRAASGRHSSRRSLDIAGFVDLDGVDPIFFDTTYYLGPRGSENTKVYSHLRHPGPRRFRPAARRRGPRHRGHRDPGAPGAACAGCRPPDSAPCGSHRGRDRTPAPAAPAAICVQAARRRPGLAHRPSEALGPAPDLR